MYQEKIYNVIVLNFSFQIVEYFSKAKKVMSTRIGKCRDFYDYESEFQKLREKIVPTDFRCLYLAIKTTYGP